MPKINIEELSDVLNAHRRKIMHNLNNPKDLNKAQDELIKWFAYRGIELIIPK